MRYVTTILALAGLLIAAAPEVARAQTADAMFEQVEASPKGTIGLGLVGAELGFVLPAAAGLDETWAFIVFPLIGGGGGAAAGYFLLDAPGNTSLSVAALVAGMVLVVPTTVLTLSLTAYDPADEYGGDEDEEIQGDTAVEMARLRLAPPPRRGGRVLADAGRSVPWARLPLLRLRF